MIKTLILSLFALFVMVAFAQPTAIAQEQPKEKTAVAAKESRWHGIIVRINKDSSNLDVRKGNVERKVFYSDNTKWTRGKTVIDMSEFKEGSDVICLGTFDEKRNFQATRIDFRR